MRTGTQFAGSLARCLKNERLSDHGEEGWDPNQVPSAGLLGPEWRGSIRWKTCSYPPTQVRREKDV